MLGNGHLSATTRLQAQPGASGLTQDMRQRRATWASTPCLVDVFLFFVWYYWSQLVTSNPPSTPLKPATGAHLLAKLAHGPYATSATRWAPTGRFQRGRGGVISNQF